MCIDMNATYMSFNNVIWAQVVAIIFTLGNILSFSCWYGLLVYTSTYSLQVLLCLRSEWSRARRKKRPSLWRDVACLWMKSIEYVMRLVFGRRRRGKQTCAAKLESHRLFFSKGA